MWDDSVLRGRGMQYEDLRQFANEMYFGGEMMLRRKDGSFLVTNSTNVVRTVRQGYLFPYSGFWFVCSLFICAGVDFGLVLRAGGRLWVSCGDEICEVHELMRGEEMSYRYAHMGTKLRVCGMVPIEEAWDER